MSRDHAGDWTEDKEDDGGANDIYKRMLELKEQYKSLTTKESDNGSTPGPSSQDSRRNAFSKYSGSAPDSEEDRSDITDRKKPLGRKKPSGESLDPTQLQTVLRQVLEEHGGSAHIDSLVEYVKSRWPTLRRRDGSPYNANDCRKVVYNCLRTNGRGLFKRDEEYEGCWAIPAALLSPKRRRGDDDSSDDDDKDDDDDEKYETQANCIAREIDEHGGSLHPDQIVIYVLRNWQRRPLEGGDELSEEEIKESVRLTLNTNPRFKRDPKKTENFIATIPAKKKKGEKEPNKKKRKLQDDGDPEDLSADDEKGRGRRTNPRRSSRGASPPTGHVCKCGATNPGINSKWKKGPNGEWLCNSCGLQWAKKKEAKREEDLNPWIRCDACHRWVQAKSDNIDDISLYDDANPNHLDYFCPKCRKKREELGLAQASEKPKKLPKKRVHDSPDAPTKQSSFEPPTTSSTSSNNHNNHNHNHGSEKHQISAQNDSQRKSARGPKRRRLEVDGSEESRLDVVERELMEAFHDDAMDDSLTNGDHIKLEKIRTLERRFEEDIAKLRQGLAQTRNQLWEKNSKDLEAQIEQLQKDKEALDEKAEDDVIASLKDLYSKKRLKLKASINDIINS